MDIKEFANKWIQADLQAFQKGNFADLEQLESPNIVIHMPPVPDLIGFEAHKEYISNACESTSDLKQEWEYITGDGNIFVLGYKASGKAIVAMPEMSIPEGAIISNDAMFALRRENDKVAEAWIKITMTLE